MFGIRLCRQVAAQSHGNRPGRNFRESCRNDQTCGVGARGESARNAGGECKGNSQAIGHTDHDVPDRGTRGEMRLHMRSCGHEFSLYSHKSAEFITP